MATYKVKVTADGGYSQLINPEKPISTKCGQLKVSKAKLEVKANIALYSDSSESTYIEYLGCYTARASDTR